MIMIANTLAIGLYLITAGMQGGHLLGKTPAPPPRLLLALGWAAVAAHGVSAIHSIYHHQNVDLSLLKVSSLIFCCITALSLLTMLRRPSSNLLVALFPLAALSIAAASLAGTNHAPQNSISPGLLTHILSSIVAYSLLTMALIQALTLALQVRHLKHHHIGGILAKLPPLQTMEQMLFELIWAGFVVLTLSLLSGMVFIDDLLSQHLAHKTFFSVFAWLVFATLLWGRHQLGWRSNTAVRWTVGGFTTLMLAYYGSKFVLEVLLVS